MIERAAHRFSAYGEVLAVTDDMAERDTVTGMGGLASSCANFIRTVENALTELQDELQELQSGGTEPVQPKSQARFEMKTQTHQNRMVRRALILATLLAGIFWLRRCARNRRRGGVDNRFLLIFDTSSDMKRRLPAVQRRSTPCWRPAERAVAFGRQRWRLDVRPGFARGQFPLQHWDAGDAADDCVEHQHVCQQTALREKNGL